MSDVAKEALSLSLRDPGALYGAYMSFLAKGGLFVPTVQSYRLGEEVLVLLTLMDEQDEIAIHGRVVWLTPRGAQGNRQTGIGVEFSDQDACVNERIEKYLAGLLGSHGVTHTL